MTIIRLKKNLGFLIAGAILFGVALNVYLEVNSTMRGKEPQCLYTLTQ